MIQRRMQQAYDTIAPAFATRYATMPDALAALGRRLLQHIPPQPAFLDVGCGHGRDMAWFEERGANVTGIDLSAGMLAEARPNVTGPLVQMDMTALAFTDRRFDAVWCMASLLHLPKASALRALREFHRVLKPAGLLVLAVQAGDAEGWEPGIYSGVERFFARYQPDEINALVRKAGFTVQTGNEIDRGSRHWIYVFASA